MKENLKKTFNNHWPTLVLAIVVGLLVVQPTVSSILNIGMDNFKGVYPIFADDEEYYMARTKDVIDGHPTLGNAYIKEHQDGPYMLPPLAEWLFAKTATTIHVSVPGLFAVSDFIFPFATTLILYGLILSLTSSKKVSLITSFIFCILFIRYFGRAINPQFSFIFLMAGLWMVGKIYFLKESKNIKKIIIYNFILAVFFGILVYVYPYFWTTVIVVYFLTLLARLAIDKDFWFPTKNLAIFFPIAFIFSLPYLVNLMKIYKNPVYSETISRMGMINTHWPAAFYNVGITLIMATVLTLLRKSMDTPKLYFSYALLGAGIILNWQNVITGKYLLFSGHYFQATVFIIWIILSIIIIPIIHRLKNKQNMINTAFAVLGVVFFLIAIFYKQADGIKRAVFTSELESKMTELQQMRPVFDWFNDNTTKDSVVLYFTDSSMYLYPVYTHNNIYGPASPFLISNDEIEERWVRQNIFNDKINEKYITENEKTIWQNDFIDKYQNKEVRRKVIRFLTGIEGEKAEILPKEYAERVFAKYKKAKDVGLEKALKKYEIDYILLDRKVEDNKRIEIELKKEKFLELIKEIDNIVIYKVN